METKTQHVVIAIAAIGEKTRALGKDNHLIWSIPDDLKRFKKKTTGHPIIIGRKTHESLPIKPLPNRTNIILTRNTSIKLPGGALVAHSPEEALAIARHAPGNDTIYVIGGAEVYRAMLPHIDILDLTLVEEQTPTKADTHFPEYSEFSVLVLREDCAHNGLHYSYVTLARPA